MIEDLFDFLMRVVFLSVVAGIALAGVALVVLLARLLWWVVQLF